MQYDAFISYRHADLDAAIAEALHKKLEHYHIPRVIRRISGKKKFSRVFRDREELPLSSNLSDNIYEALDHAEFLILICSPESLESIWVQREVSYFVETHDRSHVLPLLVRGEPEEAFPDILCHETIEMTDPDGNRILAEREVEPLAGDVRGKDKKESLKKLNTEVLRLIAAMLGCPYDSLKQRHREYRIKKTASICSVIAAVLVCFGLYAGYQKRQIEAEELQALESQAEYLADASAEALESGDRESALEMAIAVSAGENGEAPASMLQIYALNQALYSYASGAGEEYEPQAALSADDLTGGSFSEGGTYYYAVGEEGEGYIFSGESGELIEQIDLEQIRSAVESDSAEYGAVEFTIEQIIPYEEDTALVVIPNAGCIVNAATGEQAVFALEGDELVSFDLEGDIFSYCAVSGGEYVICVYDLAELEKLSQITVAEAIGYENEEGGYLYLDTDISLHTETHSLVLGISQLSLMSSLYGDTSEEIAGVLLYDYEEESAAVLSDVQAEAVLWTDDDSIAVIHRAVPETGFELSLESAYYTYYPALYDAQTGELLYTGESITTLEADYDPAILLLSPEDAGEESRCLIYSLNSRVVILDPESGNVFAQLEFDSNILSLAPMGDDSILVGTETGWFQRVSLSGSLIRYDLMELSADLAGFDFCGDQEELMLLTGSGEAVLCKIAEDEAMAKLSVVESSFGSVDSVEYLQAGDQSYRCVWLSDSSDPMAAGFALYETGSDACIYTGSYSYETYMDTELTLIEKEEDLYLYLTAAETWPAGADALILIVDLLTGETVQEFSIPAEYEIAEFFVSEDGSLVLGVNESGTMVQIDAETGELSIPAGEETTEEAVSGEETSEETQSAETIVTGGMLSSEDQMIYALLDQSSEENTVTLCAFDFASGAITEYDTEIVPAGTLMLRTGADTAAICIYNGQTLTLLDGADGSIQSEIDVADSLKEDADIDFAFFDQDQYLLLTYENRVFLYDVETGNLVDSLSFETSDPLLNLAGNTLELVTGSSGSYFALKNSSVLSSSQRFDSRCLLLVFAVDEELNLYPYAEVTDGYADFSGNEICSISDTEVYYAGIYEYAELKAKAEDLLQLSD